MTDSSQKTNKTTGYLEKRGRLKFMNSWRRYWFVLEGHLLLYYSSKEDHAGLSPCRGSITLGPTSTLKPYSSVPISFQIITRSSVVTLRADNVPEQMKWMQAIVSTLNQNPHRSLTNLDHFRYSRERVNEVMNSTDTKKDNAASPSYKNVPTIDRLEKIGGKSYNRSFRNQSFESTKSRKSSSVSSTSQKREKRSPKKFLNEHKGKGEIVLSEEDFCVCTIGDDKRRTSNINTTNIENDDCEIYESWAAVSQKVKNISKQKETNIELVNSTDLNSVEKEIEANISEKTEQEHMNTIHSTQDEEEEQNADHDTKFQRPISILGNFYSCNNEIYSENEDLKGKDCENELYATFETNNSGIFEELECTLDLNDDFESTCIYDDPYELKRDSLVSYNELNANIDDEPSNSSDGFERIYCEVDEVLVNNELLNSSCEVGEGTYETVEPRNDPGYLRVKSTEEIYNLYEKVNDLNLESMEVHEEPNEIYERKSQLCIEPSVMYGDSDKISTSKVSKEASDNLCCKPQTELCKEPSVCHEHQNEIYHNFMRPEWASTSSLIYEDPDHIFEQYSDTDVVYEEYYELYEELDAFRDRNNLVQAKDITLPENDNIYAEPDKSSENSPSDIRFFEFSVRNVKSEQSSSRIEPNISHEATKLNHGPEENESQTVNELYAIPEKKSSKKKKADQQSRSELETECVNFSQCHGPVELENFNRMAKGEEVENDLYATSQFEIDDLYSAIDSSSKPRTDIDIDEITGHLYNTLSDESENLYEDPGDIFLMKKKQNTPKKKKPRSKLTAQSSKSSDGFIQRFLKQTSRTNSDRSDKSEEFEPNETCNLDRPLVQDVSKKKTKFVGEDFCKLEHAGPAYSEALPELLKGETETDRLSGYADGGYHLQGLEIRRNQEHTYDENSDLAKRHMLLNMRDILAKKKKLIESISVQCRKSGPDKQSEMNAAPGQKTNKPEFTSDPSVVLRLHQDQFNELKETEAGHSDIISDAETTIMLQEMRDLLEKRKMLIKSMSESLPKSPHKRSTKLKNTQKLSKDRPLAE